MNSKFDFQLLFYSIFSVVFLLNSCTDNRECSETLPDDTGFSFRIVNENKENLIAAWGTTYDSDNVFFIRENGSLPIDLHIGDSGRISFNIPDFPSEITGEEQTEIFYLKLPDLNGMRWS